MFKGSMVAIVTPFKDDAVDIPCLCELVEWHIASGTHAIVAAGTTGESGTLTDAEKILVIKTVVEQVNNRIPVIAGTAHVSTQETIALTHEAMRCGADAALIMTPAYIKPTQEGLFLHYSHIAQAVPIPIILYNVPSRTACDLLPETVGRLSHISNIVGIKEATGDLKRLHALFKACDDRLDVFSGDDITGAQWLLEGARGIISVTANVAPRHMAKLCDFGLDKAVGLCLEINKALEVLHPLLFTEANPIPVKWALHRLGRIQNILRLPLTPLSASFHEPLDKVLKELQ